MTLPYLNERVNQLRLAGRTEVLHWPRLNLSARETRTQLIGWLAASVAIAAIVVVVDAFRVFLIGPAVAVLGDTVLWAFRWRSGRRLPTRAFLFAPLTITWLIAILLPALASLHSMGLWAFCAIVLAGWRLVRLVQLLREHYLDYAVENPRLSVMTRRKWQAARATGFTTAVDSARSLSEKEHRRFRRALFDLSYANGYLCWAGTMVLCSAALVWLAVSKTATLDAAVARNLLLLTGLVVPGLLCASAALLLLSYGHPWRDLKLMLKFVTVWCSSPPPTEEQLLAPWSARSRFGGGEDRATYLRWNLLLIALLILPMCVFHPWYATDGLRVYREPWLDETPFTGSQWFARLNHALRNEDVPALLRGGFVAAIIGVMPAVVSGALILGGLPAVRAGQTLFEGRAALEQEVQILTEVRATGRRA